MSVMDLPGCEGLRVNVSNGLSLGEGVRVSVSNGLSLGWWEGGDCCEECSPLLFPFHCWSIINHPSLCITAFCSGITGLFTPVSRFTVGQLFPLHCWTCASPVSLLGKKDRPWPLCVHILNIPDSCDVRKCS